MKGRNFVLITGATLAAGAVVTLLWRWMSTRQERPCPPWLSMLLENPYMNTVAGVEAVLDHLQLEEGMKILDVGCGPGRLTIPAAKCVGLSGQVTAIDLQPEMLRRAKEKANANSCENIRFIEAGIGSGLLSKNSYERAFMVTVLGEVIDKKAAMDEIYSSLKPGGILSITEALPDPHYQTYGKVNALAVACGFAASSRWRTGLAYTAHFVKPGLG